MFDILFSKQARKFLKKTEKTIAQRLRDKIRRLREEPILHDTKTIEGSSKAFRVRVGDYRILYDVDYKDHSISIATIEKRPNAYK